jgi:hypothetical protein
MMFWAVTISSVPAFLILLGPAYTPSAWICVRPSVRLQKDKYREVCGYGHAGLRYVYAGLRTYLDAHAWRYTYVYACADLLTHHHMCADLLTHHHMCAYIYAYRERDKDTQPYFSKCPLTHTKCPVHTLTQTPFTHYHSLTHYTHSVKPQDILTSTPPLVFVFLRG